MAPEPALVPVQEAGADGPRVATVDGGTEPPGGVQPVSPGGPGRDHGWTSAYLRARELEGRLYPDAIVATLPRVPSDDPLRDEWGLREDSVDRLIAYLGRFRRPLTVLEVGCGNGWVANRIAALGACRVIGLDANETELAQAKRIFGGREDLVFMSGDVTTAPPPAERPDVIVLASVLQYVGDVPGLLRRLRGWLNPGGELHVLDTPFYRSDEAPAARARTRRHYSALGVPEMAAIYHAHEWRSLEGFAFEVLYRPDSARVRFARRVLRRPRSPFPWIRIRPDGSAPGAS